ncbi:fibrinogen C domain-containing protein 1-like [Dysidea avara]|uniref:fibrinogen C domain-containing protein 1-like n=1 Tax=Dysidea avara TaxID=196820 RepID=UPI00331F3DF1
MTTITITTIILLLAIGIVTALAGCPKANAPIESCCCLGFNTSVFNKRKSGVYTMVNFCGVKCYNAEVYCDTINGGGGWLVVQRRQDGSVDFNRNWGEYEDGFGELTGEFWYGLRALHCLTGQSGWEMRMDIKYRDGSRTTLHYEQFKVGSAKDKYNLTVSGFQGTTPDLMARHNGMNFTTKDSDNDRWDGNCALLYAPARPAGGWWYNDCWNINPNNFYTNLNKILHNSHLIEIKIRPLNCNI